MSEYIENFKLVIRLCDYSNTYKMAWAKSIIELSTKYIDKDINNIDLELGDIAECMFKYYWDQTIFFNLFQSAPNQPPVILQQVKKMIEIYQEHKKDYKPVVYNRIQHELKTKYKDYYASAVKEIIKTIKTCVIDYFLNLNHISYDFYKIDKKNNLITFRKEDLLELSNNQQDLLDLINYRWSLMLEDYNSSPRIGKKVRIMDDQEIKRSRGLAFYDKFLDIENKEHVCFICGKVIDNKDLSRDHVIPWSYMYSDDLWNLVYVHKSCNSTKSNITPDDESIKQLKLRNLRLQEELHKVWQDNFGTKNVSVLQDLDFAIANDYVDKFYLGCKGC